MENQSGILRYIRAFCFYFLIFVLPVGLIPFSDHFPKIELPNLPAKPVSEEDRQYAAEKERDDEMFLHAVHGARKIKRSLRNPDSFKLMGAAYNKVTSNICIEYLAENGFGGMNRSVAILSEQEEFFTFDNSESNQKAPKECNGPDSKPIEIGYW